MQGVSILHILQLSARSAESPLLLLCGSVWLTWSVAEKNPTLRGPVADRWFHMGKIPTTQNPAKFIPVASSLLCSPGTQNTRCGAKMNPRCICFCWIFGNKNPPACCATGLHARYVTFYITVKDYCAVDFAFVRRQDWAISHVDKRIWCILYKCIISARG